MIVLILLMNNEISNYAIRNGVGSFLVIRWFTIVMVTIFCVAILYFVMFKVEVVLCNQTNVSNNKRRMVPLGPFSPENVLNMFVNLFCP